MYLDHDDIIHTFIDTFNDDCHHPLVSFRKVTRISPPGSCPTSVI